MFWPIWLKVLIWIVPGFAKDEKIGEDWDILRPQQWGKIQGLPCLHMCTSLELSNPDCFRDTNYSSHHLLDDFLVIQMQLASFYHLLNLLFHVRRWWDDVQFHRFSFSSSGWCTWDIGLIGRWGGSWFQLVLPVFWCQIRENHLWFH